MNYLTHYFYSNNKEIVTEPKLETNNKINAWELVNDEIIAEATSYNLEQKEKIESDFYTKIEEEYDILSDYEINEYDIEQISAEINVPKDLIRYCYNKNNKNVPKDLIKYYYNKSNKNVSETMKKISDSFIGR